MLLAGAVFAPGVNARAADAAGEGAADSGLSSSDPALSVQDIVVFGRRDDGTIEGIARNDELDEGDVAALGVNTVGDVIDATGVHGPRAGDGPVVLVDGRPVSGIDEVKDLPAEAVKRVQLIPPQMAMRLGQSPNRPVINLVLKPKLDQWTGDARGTGATQGEGWQREASLGRLTGNPRNRLNLTARLREIDPIYQSDRNVRNPDPDTIYDLAGNVISAGAPGSEIDPALSARAGLPVTIAPVPAGVANPTLADFAAGANRANATPTGDLRTLVARQRLYSLGANFVRTLGARTRLTLDARFETDEDRALNGPSPVLLTIPAGTPYSPFSQNVALARQVGALRFNSRTTTASLAGSLNTQMGQWSLIVLGNADWQRFSSLSDLSYDTAAYQAAISAGTVNPFVPAPASLLTVQSSRALTHEADWNINGIAQGSLAHLPAGDLGLTLRGAVRVQHLSASSTGPLGSVPSHYRRSQETLAATLALPLMSGKGASGAGSLQFDVGGTLRHVSNRGNLPEYALNLSWIPLAGVELRAGYTMERTLPSPALLAAPTVVYANYRVYDFLRQETAEVNYVTGGNPALKTGRELTLDLGAKIAPFPRLNLTLSVDYLRFDNRDVAAALPPPNAEVQAAFPDRYQRDSSGRLVSVDGRTVNFARAHSDELRWQLDFRHILASGASDRPPGPVSGGPAQAAPPPGSLRAASTGLRLNLRLAHRWVLRSDRQARAGLPVVDLLEGGATGYGGGIPRHSVELAGGLASRGLGLDISGTWRSASRINAGTTPSASDLRFSPIATLDAKAFAGLDALFPGSRWVRGARITLGCDNLFDSRQHVRDRTGVTPLAYQSELLTPVGRTVFVSLRKVL